MIFVIFITLFAIGYCYLFSFINLNAWFYFLWVPLAIILGILTTLLIVLLQLVVWSKTKPTHRYRHFILRQALQFPLLITRPIINVKGIENVPKETFVLYANHKSMLDPIFLYYTLNQVISAAGKSTLFQNKIMKLLCLSYGCISIDRNNERAGVKALMEGVARVKQGLSMIIFPEGGIKTRETEEMVDLKPGAYKLATKAGVTILPVSIIGSSKFATKKRHERIRVTIVFHKSISNSEYKNMNTTELGTMVEGIINEGVRNE